MLREMIEKIESMAKPTFHEVDGQVFANQQLIHVADKKPMPR